MKTLIITVGTRQIGWRCEDGIVRCFGADGDRSSPAHVDYLYHELQVTRSYHVPEAPNSRWSVRDLGQRYFDYCQHWLEDFSNVELLLDYQIIADYVLQGLNHIILWGSNQPETVPWFYRRLDTLWLTKLMEGKIKATWKQVETHVLIPSIVANDRIAIRQQLETFILPYSLQVQPSIDNDQFVLMIENIGATPAISEGLEICAAALVRQCQVLNVTPEPPDPLYELQANGSLASRKASTYQSIFIGEYFWPLERSRVISAWQHGDFHEAQIWLSPHRNRYQSLHRLAGYLALASNWQILNSLKEIRNSWLRSKVVAENASKEEISTWQAQISRIISANNSSADSEDNYLLAWETYFLIRIALQRQNYTAAFMQFAQTLERILYLQYKSGLWVSKGYLIPPEKSKYLGDNYNPNFKELIEAWCRLRRLSDRHKESQLLNKIREKRNDIVHSAKPVTLNEALSIWNERSFQDLGQLMLDVLKQVCDRSWQIPDKALLQSLYEWGLNLLLSEQAVFPILTDIPTNSI